MTPMLVMKSFEGETDKFKDKDTRHKWNNRSIYKPIDYQEPIDVFVKELQARVEMEYRVPTLMHEGNLKAFSSKVVFDPESKFGMVVMTNQSFEEIYGYGLIKEIFGDNVNSNIVTSEGGRLFSIRTTGSR
ncbi:hypothetical protein [Paenibacillus sp. QZ-Y1]|uniref:hypothetical protein n=1 Tax=Paenibacillus sp. QZ-Y1 TaxID=3414511 RepID=UPI003F78BFE2